jgi:Protein of unknown function (DUF3105)
VCCAVFRRLAAVLLVAALAAPVLTACSGGGDDDSAGGSVPEGEVSGRPTSGGVPIGAAPEGIEGVEAFRIDGHTNTEEPLDYDHKPPTGGDHFPVPATCGFYGTDRPPDELLVHDLEHGAVWFAYQPNLPTEERDALRQLVGREAKTTATPYDGLDSPLVLTAWGRQLAVGSLDDPRVQQFIDTYRNSPDAPEPTSACQGIGNPEVAAPTS